MFTQIERDFLRKLLLAEQELTRNDRDADKIDRDDAKERGDEANYAELDALYTESVLDLGIIQDILDKIK